MKKILWMSLVALLSVAFSAQAQTIIHTEALSCPEDTAIQIQMIFADSVDMQIQYGLSPGTYPYQTSWQTFADSLPASIHLHALLPDTLYYYRVRYRPPGSSLIQTRNEHHFHTARSVAHSFVFTVQADPHLDEQSDTAIYRRCLQNQLEDNPDFTIDLGDFLMTDKLKNSSNQIPFDTIPFRCHLLRHYYDSISHSVPLFWALGNHEGEAAWNMNGTANNIAVWDAKQRMQYFPNPITDGFYSADTTQFAFTGLRENYYSFTWGNALFVILDPYGYTSTKPDSLHGWRWTLGKGQYDWLKYTLEHSNATFKFVFAHQLIGGDPDGRGGVEFADRYEWGGNNLDGSPGFATNRPGWYKPIKDLLTENKVNIFFHGHDHFFGKQEKDCLIYQETPQPSHPNFLTTNQATDYGYVQGQILSNSGHIRITVNPNDTKVEYIRAYKTADESATRHNKDIAATYIIPAVNCYDSLSTDIPIIWNAEYANEFIYPNPFHQETQIQFSLKKTDNISIDIYNANGTLVRRLLNTTTMLAGKYLVSWDGKDNHAQKLPSGLYLIRCYTDSTLLFTDKIIFHQD